MHSVCVSICVRMCACVISQEQFLWYMTAMCGLNGECIYMYIYVYAYIHTYICICTVSVYLYV